MTGRIARALVSTLVSSIAGSLLAGCGLLSGDLPGQPTGDNHCQYAMNGKQTHCQDFLGYSSLTLQTEKDTCVASKATFGSGRCDRTGSLGGCEFADPVTSGARIITWYFSGFVGVGGRAVMTSADAMMQCVPDGGAGNYDSP